MADLKGATRNMEIRCKTFEKREQTCIDLKAMAKLRMDTARMKIRKMHETRAEKQDLIERADYKAKTLENRLKTLEAKIENTRQSMRIENDASAEIMCASKHLKESFQKQSELQAKIIRGMRRKDALEKQIHVFSDKESRYREKMSTLLERLKYLVNRQDEMKKSILDKVANIKKMHAAMIELEPKLRESYTRMRKNEVDVHVLEEKIARKEDEIRKVHRDAIFSAEEKERAFVKFEVQKERKFKGPDALKHLTR